MGVVPTVCLFDVRPLFEPRLPPAVPCRQVTLQARLGGAGQCHGNLSELPVGFQSGPSSQTLGNGLELVELAVLNGNIIGPEQLPHTPAPVDDYGPDGVAEPLQRVFSSPVTRHPLRSNERVVDDTARVRVLGYQQSVAAGEESGVNDEDDGTGCWRWERYPYRGQLLPDPIDALPPFERQLVQCPPAPDVIPPQRGPVPATALPGLELRPAHVAGIPLTAVLDALLTGTVRVASGALFLATIPLL